MRRISLSNRIIVRVTITTLVATGVTYGWLYLKQSHVQDYLGERALVRQAEEIADFISTNDDGSIDLKLPPRLSESYNSPGSRYRYAIQDDAGRIVAASGRGIGPLAESMYGQNQHTYKSEGAENRIIGAAFRNTIGKSTFTTQVEQTVPRVQSLSAAVLEEFIADGGWPGIPFQIALLGISASL